MDGFGYQAPVKTGAFLCKTHKKAP